MSCFTCRRMWSWTDYRSIHEKRWKGKRDCYLYSAPNYSPSARGFGFYPPWGCRVYHLAPPLPFYHPPTAYLDRRPNEGLTRTLHDYEDCGCLLALTVDLWGHRRFRSCHTGRGLSLPVLSRVVSCALIFSCQRLDIAAFLDSGCQVVFLDIPPPHNPGDCLKSTIGTPMCQIVTF